MTCSTNIYNIETATIVQFNTYHNSDNLIDLFELHVKRYLDSTSLFPLNINDQMYVFQYPVCNCISLLPNKGHFIY